jgi:hypothetical protein
MCQKKGEKCKDHLECGPEGQCKNGKCTGLGLGVKDQLEAGIAKPKDPCPNPENKIDWETITGSSWEEIYKMKSVTVVPVKKTKRRKY